MICRPPIAVPMELALVLEQAAVAVDPLARDPAQGRDVERDDADARPGSAAGRTGPSGRRRRRSSARPGRWSRGRATRSWATRSLIADPRADVAGEALGEELDRQAQHVPEEAARAGHRQPGLQAQQVGLLQPGQERRSASAASAHAEEQRRQPVAAALEQDARRRRPWRRPATTSPGTTRARPARQHEGERRRRRRRAGGASAGSRLRRRAAASRTPDPARRSAPRR